MSYEILDPNYTIESVMASVKYVLSRDREKLKTGVEFFVMEYWNVYPRSFSPNVSC